jgi:pyrroloquinoline-quinone synthase
MTFTENLLVELASKHLLKHPFYEAWNAGTLKKSTLQTYSRQYFKHVEAFPRYISATHSLCDKIEDRQVLLANLMDEEQGEKNHPELWTRFSEALGGSREELKTERALPQTQNLVDTFEKLSRSSYAEGLGALFAYEYQVPEVAASKIDGLTKHYDVTADRDLEFFRVHLTADVYHSQACAKMLDSLSAPEQEQARKAAHQAADSLWGFLDGMTEVCHQTM